MISVGENMFVRLTHEQPTRSEAAEDVVRELDRLGLAPRFLAAVLAARPRQALL